MPLPAAHVQRPKTRARAATPSEVTPDQTRLAINAARRGQPARWFGILDFFRQEDDEIPGALRSLFEAVLAGGIAFPPADDSDEAVRQSEDLTAVFDELDSLNLLDALLHAHWYGFRSARLDWDAFGRPARTLQAPVTYELLPMDFLHAQKERQADEHTTLYVGERPYHTYDPGALLLFSAAKLPSYQDIDFTAFGCGKPAARFATFSLFNWEDWASYGEMWGLPTILGTLLQGWKDDDKKLLERAVFGIGNDSRGVITDKAKIERLMAQAGGDAVFKGIDEAARLARARIIKSESLTDNMNKHGSNAAMLTVNGIRLDVARGLARRLARMIHRRVVLEFCRLNYGRCLVQTRIPVKEIQDLLRELAVTRGLVELGVPVSMADAYEQFGRRPPRDTGDQIPGKRRGLIDPFTALGT
jgi:phage gp29-like protein